MPARTYIERGPLISGMTAPQRQHLVRRAQQIRRQSENIVNFYFGVKRVKAIATGEDAMVFIVRRKLPLPQVNPSEFIPTWLYTTETLGSYFMPTDVLEAESEG